MVHPVDWCLYPLGLGLDDVYNWIPFCKGVPVRIFWEFTPPTKGSEVSKGVDTSNLRFRGVEILFLELESRIQTDPFRTHKV